MYHAVILAGDPGEELRPLTGEERPTAFLALGDRRTLLQRSVDRLVEFIPIDRLWVIVRPEHRARAAAQLDRAIHVVDPGGDVTGGALAVALSGIASVEEGSAGVLLQPATHVVSDEPTYRARLLAGFDVAMSEGTGVSFTIGSAERQEKATGIQAWPADVLSERLAAFTREQAAAVRDAPATDDDDLTAVPLGDVGWIDVADWAAVRTLLEYVEKPWGYERLWALNRHYAGKILFINAGESLSLQYHETKDETIRIAAGRMRFRVGHSVEALETVVLEPGTSYAIRPGLIHQMEAVEDCTVIEVSTPQLADVVRLEDRYGRA